MVNSCPNWHKTAFKFQRIRCTKCFTSPDNQKKEETTPESRVPAWFLVHDMMLCRCKLLQKEDVSGCSARLRSVKYAFHKGSQGTAGEAGLHKKVQNGKASCCTLLKRITKLKCVNPEVRSVDINPTEEVASLGPMAPCRSHHRNHTR